MAKTTVSSGYIAAGAVGVTELAFSDGTAGQFLKTDWFRKNEFIVAAAGIVLSYFYIWGTKYTVSGTDNLLWPARFIGFGVGMVIYAAFVSYFFKEVFSSKTLVSLVLALILICIQVLWKTN